MNIKKDQTDFNNIKKARPKETLESSTSFQKGSSFFLKVAVKDGQVDTANRILKKRMQRAGIFDYLQKHKHHIAKTEKRQLKQAERLKVIKKYLRNRLKKEGF